MRILAPLLLFAACRATEPQPTALATDAAPAAPVAAASSATEAAVPTPRIEPYPDPPVDRVALHASEWALLHEQYPAAKDVSARLPPWVAPGHTTGALGYLATGTQESPGPSYLLAHDGSEGPAPLSFAVSARKPFPIASLATFDAGKPPHAGPVALGHIAGELWFAGSSVAHVDLGRLPGSMHHTVVEGPRGFRFLAIYDGFMDPNMVDLHLLAMVEGHLAPVLRLTVMREPYGMWPCDGDPNGDGPRECSWFAPLPQVLDADGTGVELLAWSYDPKSDSECKSAPFRCPLSQQAFVYTEASRRFEPRGEKIEAMKPFFRVHQPRPDQKPSAWAGRYAFTWKGGPGVAGGITAVRTYDVMVTGGEGDLQVTLTEAGTQTMGAAYDAHGVVTADGLAITLDQCHSDGDRECGAAKAGDVVAVLTNARRLRFGTLSAPDGSTKELAGGKRP